MRHPVYVRFLLGAPVDVNLMESAFADAPGGVARYVDAEELKDARARIAELEARIQSALDVAGGRWSEWGDRALTVAEILEGKA